MIQGLAAHRAGDGEQRAAREPAIIVVGASTGGPQALVALLSRMAPVLRQGLGMPPVCIALHMPRDLMPVIATYLAGRCAIATSVVGEASCLAGGRVYFAPGDRHLGFTCRGGEAAVAPLAAPGRGRSAVNALFAGAADAFGPRVLGIVLSGMGEDGLEGSRAIVDHGGAVLVQDRGSSAVWGMPGAVARAGLAARVLPPAALAAEVIGRVQGGLVPAAVRSLPVLPLRAEDGAARPGGKAWR